MIVELKANVADSCGLFIGMTSLKASNNLLELCTRGRFPPNLVRVV